MLHVVYAVRINQKSPYNIVVLSLIHAMICSVRRNWVSPGLRNDNRTTS